jgi:uncharacterized protein
LENPFKYGGIVRGQYFADRQIELAELAREMENLNRVFLISPRRYGKTCLLANLLDRLERRNIAVAYLDLNAYPELRSFAAAFTQVTSRALESRTDKLLKIFAGLQRLRPKVSVGPDGALSGSLEVATGEKEALPALLEGMRHAEALAKKTKRKLVVIIDEFSDLEKYNGPSVEKALRAEIQQQASIGYIFSGSEESVMLSMVQDRKRAFFKLGRIMELGPIGRKEYIDFIYRWLCKGAYQVKKEDLGQILDMGRDVPLNIQRLCHTLWEKARERGKITASLIGELPFIVARQDSPHFELLWHTASPQQKLLLMALSREPDAKPFSRDFQITYGIGPSSSIKASLDSLVKKGILRRGKNGSYQFSDAFMLYWIRSMQQNEEGSKGRFLAR